MQTILINNDVHPKFSFLPVFRLVALAIGEVAKSEKIFYVCLCEPAGAVERIIPAYASVPSYHAIHACAVHRFAIGNGFAQRLACQHKQVLERNKKHPINWMFFRIRFLIFL